MLVIMKKSRDKLDVSIKISFGAYKKQEFMR